MKVNVMFKCIRWQLGKTPLMILNGTKMPLDLVADTNLDGPALGKHSEVIEFDIVFIGGNVSYSTKFAISTVKTLSCWDLILTVNDYFHELGIEGLFDVHDIILKGELVSIQCV